MKTFYVIEDQSGDHPIWSQLVLEEIPKLDTKPKTWQGEKPEGNWSLRVGIIHLLTDGAYMEAGITTPPTVEQAPAIYCIDKEAGTEDVLHNATLAQAVDFIVQRLP
jgi:hypothetical protein